MKRESERDKRSGEKEESDVSKVTHGIEINSKRKRRKKNTEEKEKKNRLTNKNKKLATDRRQRAIS